MSDFKDHFSGHARDYAAARPNYPAALFAWLTEQSPARARAWDAGCGNGQAALALAEHFAEVRATDPSAAQIAQASAHPRVRYGVARAEDGPGDDGPCDLVTVAQALHWFDVAAFNAAAARALRPGGLMAQWCYELARIAPAIDAQVHALYLGTLGPYWPPERRHVENGYAELDFPFEPLAVPTFEMRHRWTLDQFLDYVGTWSALQRFRGATGIDPLTALRAELAPLWGDGARDVRWPLTVRAGRRA